MESTRPMDSGKMFQEHCPAMSQQQEVISEKSSRRLSANAQDTLTIMFLNLRNGNEPEAWSETAGAQLGVSQMHNRQFLREDAGYSLSAILEETVPEKYSLSARACQGIINRAERRGKILPELLKDALEERIASAQNLPLSNQTNEDDAEE